MTYRDSAYEFRAIAYDYRRLLGEAQAEIARLQAEVEALKTARDMLGRFWDKAKQEAHTAWNDAIEAAALRIAGRDWFLEDGIESTPSEDIRALRKTRGL